MGYFLHQQRKGSDLEMSKTIMQTMLLTIHFLNERI
jgi:hypothetical protein